MNKDTIVLADNSYTIRRIVELSFTEEGIELISFENGLNLKDKLLELKPKIVLVDIKLPELNGYETCKFINENESLKDTKVFLLKGGFEPIDEGLLKELKYVDIITKPFDSNALVNTLKELIQKKEDKTISPKPEVIPETMPEDLPGIEGIGESDEEISFSDIKEEIESPKPESGENEKIEEDIPKEEVLPSEEKTQGSPPETDDLKFDNIEEIENPFKDEQPIGQEDEENMDDEELEVKENIKIQEDELEIASLTQEEINIKKIIDKKGKDIEPEILLEDKKDEEPEEETDDQAVDSLRESAEGEEAKEPETPLDVKEVIEAEKPKEIEMDEQKEEMGLQIEEPEIEEKITPVDQEEEGEVSVSESPKIEKEPQIDLESEIADLGLEEKKDEKIQLDIQKEEIIHKVEDTLTVAVKEILWEIVPPLAEKIIKEEIKKIKSEIDSTAE
ncbi:MAG: response regulator [Candidatus Aminicenantes bacterium]|nr:response regulator [Candidatus Aminicenantes bacterium]